MFADEFLPVSDVPGEVATVVAAEPRVVWGVLFGADLVEVGKLWRPVIEYAPVPAGRFCDFGEPGCGKTIHALSVRPLADGRSLLSGLMRTATTGEHARRWFRRYWTFGVGSGAQILVRALLEMIRQTAEDAQAAGAGQAR